MGSPKISGLQGAAWTVSRVLQPPELQAATSAADQPSGWGLQTQRPTAAESTATRPFDRTESEGRGRRSPHLGEPWTRCMTPCRGRRERQGPLGAAEPGSVWGADQKARGKRAGRASRLTTGVPPPRPVETTHLEARVTDAVHTCPNHRADPQRVCKHVLRQT